MSNIHKISRLTSTYKGYLDRTEICRYPPTRVWVEATSNCNLRCSFCGNRDLTKDQRGNMSFELFQQLADEAAGKVNQFNLFHRGESLLHPRIGEMIRYAGARGIHTRINTNGTLLNANLGAELINAGLDMLSFSFDGYDPEMYEANRPGAHFDRVLGNILGFLELKKAMNACKPFVTIEVMEIADVPKRDLMEKQRAFVHKFKGLPLDKFIIRKQHNWAGMIDTGQKMSCNRIPCPLLWHAMVVFWDGRVMPCPQDFFGSLELGRIGDTGLMDIWNGQEIRRMRREMANPGLMDRHPCVECDRIARATFAGVPVDYLGRFLSEAVFGNGWLSRKLPH